MIGDRQDAALFLKKKKRSLMSGIPSFIVEIVDSRHTLRYVFTNVCRPKGTFISGSSD